jgi:hypothetical protein
MRVPRRTNIGIPAFFIISITLSLISCVILMETHISDSTVHIVTFVAGILASNLGAIVHYYFGRD